MSVSRTLRLTPQLFNVVFVSQFTHNTKTSIGVDSFYEAIIITHIVADEDGSLKVKNIEEFIDSKRFSTMCGCLRRQGPSSVLCVSDALQQRNEKSTLRWRDRQINLCGL